MTSASFLETVLASGLDVPILTAQDPRWIGCSRGRGRVGGSGIGSAVPWSAEPLGMQWAGRTFGREERGSAVLRRASRMR